MIQHIYVVYSALKSINKYMYIYVHIIRIIKFTNCTYTGITNIITEKLSPFVKQTIYDKVYVFNNFYCIPVFYYDSNDILSTY